MTSNQAVRPACEPLRLAAGPVFACSGQGSQRPGMGADLMDVPEVAAVFECASDVFGLDVAALCSEQGDPSALNDTRSAQAAIATLSIAVGRALRSRGVEPSALVGFSLGQVSALALSGMLTDEQALSLVSVRARLMGEAADANPGAMSALLKADEDAVEALVSQCAQGEVLVAANFNCPGQIVVSGSVGAIGRAEEAWAARGGRFSRLSTSGAFHSPLMGDALEPFSAYLENVAFCEPCVPLICNVDARPLSASTVRDHLARHLVSAVRFSQSIDLLSASGASSYVEVGFGGVLTGLIRRIDKDAARMCVQDRASFDDCLALAAQGAFAGRG
ncbi:MAG: ACP S-malonyltransferase [Berryella intestinalis]|uniref:ACP S-malonyltransferase n=1 Tax=Berryella intestinalis TaxID=1531429 RepID=UPI002A5255B6|nr:ACP S-malonyltransferase [Berryella intestinalis]MDD7369970.1 ACP S-malonyltransferase [Berryella intestinalis]MDY3129416.1 ACP S-malonyltransferase [Berryella intestinalis]